MTQYVYLFVRQDLPIEHQIIQTNHATYQLAVNYKPPETVPNIVLIGVPDKKGLERVLEKLRTYSIPHAKFVEPDYDFGLTAVCTAPLVGAERIPLENYRPYRYPRSSEKEHQTFSLEDGGSIPSAGATL